MTRSTAAALPFALSAQEAESLRSHARSLGWKAGFEDFILASRPERARQLRAFIPIRHAGWQALADPSLRQHAMVFDAGLGAPAIALSSHMKTVTACFPSEAHADCARYRISHLGISNIECVNGSEAGKTLPERLDLVVMYGDWPLDLPGYDLESLRGRIVSGGSLVMVLPGSAASVKDLMARTRKAFPGAEAFRYNGPPLEANEITSFGASGEPLVRRMRSWLAHHRAPGFLLVARNARHSSTLVSACLRHVERAASTRIDAGRLLFAYPAGFTVLGQSAKKQGVVLRMALDTRSTIRYRTNHATLTVLSGMEESVRAAVPRPLDAGEHEGREFFAESAVNGLPISAQMLSSRTSAADVTAAALAWVGNLHRASSIPGDRRGNALEEQVRAPMRIAAERLRLGTAGEWSALADAVVAKLSGAGFPRVLAHGDFSVDNVLVSPRNRRVTGVFDWDLSVAHSLPLSDPLYFLVTVRRLRDRIAFGQAFREVILGRFTEHESHALRAYCTGLQLSFDIIKAFAVLTWVDHIARRTLFPEHYHFPHWSADMGNGAWEAAREGPL